MDNAQQFELFQELEKAKSNKSLRPEGAGILDLKRFKRAIFLVIYSIIVLIIGFIHWDYDPETKPVNVQGVLALADQTDENMGGFQCIPELYRNYDTWKLTQPEDRDRFKPDTTGFTPTKVKLEAGDLLIFNSTEPHGIRANNSGDKVRIAQYISMMPAEEDNQELRQWRVNSWKNRIAPEGYAFPGDPRNWEQTKYDTAELNELGKKLLGLDNW